MKFTKNDCIFTKNEKLGLTFSINIVYNRLENKFKL